MIGFLWFLLDAVLSVLPALSFTLLLYMFAATIVAVLRMFVNILKLKFAETYISRLDTFVAESKIGYIFFWLSWLLCVWVSTEIEGFPFPYLFVG